MDDRLVEILNDVYDLEPEEISDAMTPDDVSLWDSLNHLKLITAVEQTFDIQFSMDTVQGIDSIGKLQAPIASQA